MSISSSRTVPFIIAGVATMTIIVFIGCAPAAQPTPTVPAATLTATVVVSTTPPVTPLAVTATPSQADCPKLESRLYQLAIAGDPAAFAESHRLYYVDGNTRVVIELQSPDENLPEGYTILVETRRGASVRALVPIKDLCRLSNESKVRFIQVPMEPVR